MSSRGSRRRGRPPKTPVAAAVERPRNLKKPKYLLERATSPAVVEERGRKSRGRGQTRAAFKRRGYNPDAVDDRQSDFLYGSDFGESDSSQSPSRPEEEEEEEERDSPDEEEDAASSHVDDSSDSDFSLSSYRSVAAVPRKLGAHPPTPLPIWLQDVEVTPLELPKSSEDILVPCEHVMQVMSVYEVMRHFRALVRLSPFRFEDMCAAMVAEEMSVLLAEMHMVLLKTLLREEDSQQTMFGPFDHKDSVNIVYYCIDPMTWPEVLRAYVESDKSFSPEALHILTKTEYPFTTFENRLNVLQFLTDQVLITNPIREYLIIEAKHQYDDHCRICHRLGNLLCCETCTAVYHLHCIDPALTEIPEDDWQCDVCRSHKLPGVTDCVPAIEKSGLLCRQESLGFDRHGRKYWFLCRRIFVESNNGDLWYYSTKLQFEDLMDHLDPTLYEADLCAKINENHSEIVRQMEITEKLTNANKGNRKSYFEIEHGNLLQVQKERAQRKVEEEEEKRKEEERLLKEKEATTQEERIEVEEVGLESSLVELTPESESGVEGMDVDKPDATLSHVQNGACEEMVEIDSVECNIPTTTDEMPLMNHESGENREGALRAGNNHSLTKSIDGQEETDMEVDGDEPKNCLKEGGKKNIIVTRSKTGSLQPKTFGVDNLKKKGSLIFISDEKKDKEFVIGEGMDMIRLTRNKTQQIAAGTLYFKLGMEGTYKNYVNQYSINVAALNKMQHNEERDKRRHLSHKFSLTTASEFKWHGAVTGSRAILVNTLRQTMLQLESNVPASLMHTNWHLLRKPWMLAVTSSVLPWEFSRALVVLETCIKPVVYNPVWNEYLGHIRLQRITSAEREERKKIEKKEKKEKDEEEERNRLGYHLVKYTLGLKHNVWKQKGEEYRVHGQWGWLWLSATRTYRALDARTVGLRAGPVRHSMVKEEKPAQKLDPETGELVLDKSDVDLKIDTEMPNGFPRLDRSSILPGSVHIDTVDITRGLVSPSRKLYPKIARKSKLDDLLERRLQLKALEEKEMATMVRPIF